jgi:hypothetical protein
MKTHLVVLALCLAALGLALEPPRSIDIAIGDIKIRLDAAKRYYMNRVEFQGQPMGVDQRGYHYGTVFFVKGEKGFAGTGHTEAGYGETVDKLQILIDGTSVDYMNCNSFSGQELLLRKRSRVGHFSIDYTLAIVGGRMDESVAISSDADVAMNIIYHFMHPWELRFTDFCAVKADGALLRGTFAGRGAFPLKRTDIQAVACYDRQSGYGLVTRDLGGEGHGKPLRMLWDRPVYRKDYFADYSEQRFPKGHRATYAASTAFFRQPDASRWEQEALKAAGLLTGR